MIERSARARSKPANDNIEPFPAQPTQVTIMPRTSRRHPTMPAASLRIGSRALLIAGLVILVALSGALLIGLAVVGLLAVAIGGLEIIRRQFRRKPLGGLDQQVVG